MPQQIAIELHDDVAERLQAIPTATTFGERQLTLHYLATQWDGSANVFENGTLLGGATRALGMGMMYNEARDDSVRLYTYDWFSLHQPLDLQDDIWIALTEAGLLTVEEVNAAHAGGTFLPLFASLHMDEDYWPLVKPGFGYLPGHRDEVAPDGLPLFVAPEADFNIAFIDGCKSWYGTKHWFKEIVPRLLPNTDILFQDYGHYTCFWISSLIGMFREHFDLVAYVDRTYIWRLLSVPSQAEVEAKFPDEPTDVTRDTYEEIYKKLLSEAMMREDRYAVMIHQAHLAAAYAYIGLKDEAVPILDDLLMRVEWMPHRDYLKQARISPTYTPEERILLP